MLVKKTSSCVEMLEWFEANGQIVQNPQPGDIVFFKFKTNNRRTNHVGLVYSVSSINSFKSEEGNTSINSDDNGGSVMLRNRTSANVVAFARPKYGPSQLQKILDIADGELGTSEYPPNSNNVKYNTWFYKHAVSGPKYPWCAVFISYIFDTLERGATPITPQNRPTLKMGSTGMYVRQLQEALSKKGFTVKIDGVFGPLTDAYVRQFQRMFELEDDGVVGPKTWAALSK